MSSESPLSGLPNFNALAGTGESSLGHGPSTAEADVKAALPRDDKSSQSGASSRRNVDRDQEPPPPYEEGDSPLLGFTYTMSAGGAASIITQVQQGAPAPVNTLSGKSFSM